MNDKKHVFALRALGALRFSLFSRFDQTIVWLTAICSAILNYRAVHFLLSIGEAIPEGIVIVAAAAVAGIVAIVLKDETFESVKRLAWNSNSVFSVPRFRVSVRLFFATRHPALFLFMFLGIFGASLFLYTATGNDETAIEIATESKELYRQELANLEYNFQEERSSLIAAIQKYQNLDRIKYGVIPTQAKLDSLTTVYHARKGFYLEKLSASNQQLAAFRPTKLLSDIIRKSFALRLIICALIGALLSLCVDLSQYRRISVSFASAYDRIYFDPSIISNNIITDSPVSYSPVDSPVSNQLETVDEPMFYEDEGETTDEPTEKQSAVLEMWQKGYRNISEIAEKCATTRDTVRATLKQFLPSEYEKFKQQNKHTPPAYKTEEQPA